MSAKTETEAVVASEAEEQEPGFVVVTRLEDLQRMQKDVLEDLRTMKGKVTCQDMRMAAVERAAELNIYIRRVMLSFAATMTPVVLSMMLDLYLPTEHEASGSIQSSDTHFVRSISRLLLAFAVCVGIPMLLQAVGSLQEAQFDHQVDLTSKSNTTNNANCISNTDTDSEKDEDTENGSGCIQEDQLDKVDLMSKANTTNNSNCTSNTDIDKDEDTIQCSYHSSVCNRYKQM